ncbi:nucleotidyltransferase family protein [Pseudarthrobacter sp. SL88]|uniref:nucleotidyltransferase family protein n=1 Tax=Pseudarthrobacter sp. SL88 TaxID=2994666 RepID=UPI002276602C|nr:nucleotidyltransferase family protein [Pseudarthrobacter sp. SL88]MCY1673799.1 nucleotidyltransferase family protein [Pseudarthrobacter sp. SL88]
MDNPEDIVQLSVSEGVLLGHALVARVANELGIRAFFIKGPVSVLQGLRPAKTSGDVDVLVPPQDLETIVEALQERGWRKRPVDHDSKTFPRHSITVGHPEWPCCIDVHYRFPGMEAAAAECFEVMWDNTERVVLAGQDIRVPSKPLAILLLALHALRSPALPACRDELDFLSGAVSQQSLALPVLDLSTTTGSLAATRPFLEKLLPENMALLWPEPSTEWRNRVLAQEPGSARIIALAQARWQDKPMMLWRAVFPRGEVFLTRNIYADMSVKGRLVQHVARWARFLRSVPRITRDLNRYRA